MRKVRDIDREAISARMNEYMELLGLNGKEMSERTGIDQSVISAYKNGRFAPSAPMLRRIVMSTGLSADWWLGL